MIGARKNISSGKIGGGDGRSGCRRRRKGVSDRDSARFDTLALQRTRGRAGSACVVQGAEFFDQQFAGDQFHLEIKRALHEDPDGFLLGHGILLPWECFFAAPAFSFAYLIGGFSGKLDWGNEGGWAVRGEKNTIFSGCRFLLVDTIGKMQHTVFAVVMCSGGGAVAAMAAGASELRG